MKDETEHDSKNHLLTGPLQLAWTKEPLEFLTRISDHNHW